VPAGGGCRRFWPVRTIWLKRGSSQGRRSRRVRSSKRSGDVLTACRVKGIVGGNRIECDFRKRKYREGHAKNVASAVGAQPVTAKPASINCFWISKAMISSSSTTITLTRSLWTVAFGSRAWRETVFGLDIAKLGKEPGATPCTKVSGWSGWLEASISHWTTPGGISGRFRTASLKLDSDEPITTKTLSVRHGS